MVRITLEQAFHGTEIELDLSVPEYDEQGFAHRVPHRIKVRIPKGVTDGQKLRVPGKGGKGMHGGRDGDLYLDIQVQTAPAVSRRRSGPLRRSSAGAVGSGARHQRADAHAGGAVTLKVPPARVPGSSCGCRARTGASGRERQGDLFAIVQIVVPTVVDERERSLFRELAEIVEFNPRAHFEQEAAR